MIMCVCVNTMEVSVVVLRGFVPSSTVPSQYRIMPAVLVYTCVGATWAFLVHLNRQVQLYLIMAL